MVKTTYVSSDKKQVRTYKQKLVDFILELANGDDHLRNVLNSRLEGYPRLSNDEQNGLIITSAANFYTIVIKD